MRYVEGAWNVERRKLLTEGNAGALSGLFPIDSVLKKWLRYKATKSALSSDELNNALTSKRFTHQRIDNLFANNLSVDQGAKYAKYLHMNLSTLSPYVSGPNSVKISTPVEALAAQNITVDKCYLVSCTNSRASDLAAAAKVFKDAVKETGGPVRIAKGVSFYIAAASMPEQLAAEEAGDWQAMLDAGAVPLPSGCKTLLDHTFLSDPLRDCFFSRKLSCTSRLPISPTRSLLIPQIFATKANADSEMRQVDHV